MDKIATFEQFLATNTTQFSILNYSINILLTAGLAFLLALLYNRYGHSLSNRKTFGKNFVFLAVTTMIIITIVKSSLALSLGLVGALSIVRFRAAIKEPEELTYLFLNIAIGLGLGADQKLATIVGFIFIALYLIGRDSFHKKSDQENQNLIITVSAQSPLKGQLNEIVEILKLYCVKVSLKRFDENENMLESSFIVELASFKQVNDAKNDLQQKFDDLTISFIDNNISV
jgi:hypothetical protein